VIMNYFLEHNRYLNLFGIILVLGCAWIFSANKKQINYRSLLTALGLQVLLAFLTLRTGLGYAIVGKLAEGVSALYRYGEQGAEFLFGALSQIQAPWHFVFAFRVLPVIVFFGALMALLFHYNIVQKLTAPITRVLYPLLGTSAAETLCAVANSFLGQTEAPLLIRHYLARLTRSELLTVMVSGMATISGPILGVYAAMGVPAVYLLSSSVMAIPAAILLSKVLVPETQEVETQHGLAVSKIPEGTNVFGALAQGTSDGLQLALAVGAMLIAFIALIACINGLLGVLSTGLTSLFSLVGLSWKVPALSLQAIFNVLFAPIGWLLGLSGEEIFKAAELIGLRLSVNEMVAYSTMLTMGLSQRAVALLTFALCGFANLSSIGIQVAGIGALAPEQKKNLSQLGLYAVLGGTLANLLCAFVAGLML
jgi:CNT family concentrative nucleoside transporter